jgi:hypothetical protein
LTAYVEINLASPEVDDYAGCSELTGPAMAPPPGAIGVTFRPLLSDRRSRRTLGALVLPVVALDAAFVLVLLLGACLADRVPPVAVVAAVGLAVTQALRLANLVGLWRVTAAAHDPVPLVAQPGLRVALLTTIVPSCEPVDMVSATLTAMTRVRHDGPLDVWILDEGDDPAVRAVCARLGVRHFSRRGRTEFNTSRGVFRARTKAGNHNAWRAVHGVGYDVVAQLDPDHVPRPDFLERTLGYFRDPDVAFVVAPQVYANRDAYVPRAAAAQSYVFAGLIQRGGNGLGAPLLIGTNHVYRTAAWNQIGGYQDSIIEDHLTSMTVHATINPSTGRPWTGVYTPDVIAVGQAPANWGDFLRQQRRWAFGVWQIVLSASPRLLGRLTGRQRFGYLFLQTFYPTVGISWTITSLATIGYLVGLPSPPGVGGWGWLLPAAATAGEVALFRWLRRFYLSERERASGVFAGFLITAVAAPVYAAAGLTALLRRDLEFEVTGKGGLRGNGGRAIFRPQVVAVIALVAALATGAVAGLAPPTAVAWALVGIATALLPFLSSPPRRSDRQLGRCRDFPRRTHPRRSPPARSRRRRDPLAAATPRAANRLDPGSARHR